MICRCQYGRSSARAWLARTWRPSRDQAGRAETVTESRRDRRNLMRIPCLASARRDRRRTALIAPLVLGLVVALTASAPPASASEVLGQDGATRYRAEVRRTAHGIPHVRASDYGSLGFGYGYASAEDNVCVLAEEFVTLAGERSRFFGPEGTYSLFGQTYRNLDSDFFYRSLLQARVVENLLAAGPRDTPPGPSARARTLVRGYAAGYDRLLRDRRDAGLTDPRCRDASWVRPIEASDVWRRLYRVATLLGSGGMLQGIATARPPSTSAAPVVVPPAERVRRARSLLPGAGTLSPGSNAYGLGGEATVNGRGMLLANPHFPWDGPERFYEAHLTIPGEVDVFGASLFGTPTVQIGHNAKVAWTHTVSTGQRFTPFELRLVPGDPTRYVVDGEIHRMQTQRVTVTVPGDGGQLQTRSRTLYRTRFGPMVVVPGLFEWSAQTAYAIRDANAGNLRLADTWLAMAKATSTRDLVDVIRRQQGLPFVNTIAADAGGTTVYADLSVTPHVTDARAARCVTSPLGRTLFAETGLPLLDGSTAACDWGRDADAVEPGILGPARLPVLFRRDFVTNSNDSHWLSNPARPLTGFDRVIGDERTERSLRTRLGIRMVQQRLAGTDGLPGRRFTPGRLQTVVFNNRSYGGELLLDDLVRLCEAQPAVSLPDGTTVALPPACRALRGWDRHADLHSTGAHLFREFMLQRQADWLTVPFDPADPVNTPRRLNRANPAVLQALGEAVRILQGSGIPLDAPLGTLQSEPRGTDRIPIHGGHPDEGVFNMTIAPFQGPAGYPKVVHGSSFVMVTGFTAHGPRSRAILTYSQSTDPSSPFFADQTRMYSNKQWVHVPFTEAEIVADPVLRRYTVVQR
nr:aculeacin-A acylase [uncultured bacterium]